jgi:hypothetical protein
MLHSWTRWRTTGQGGQSCCAAGWLDLSRGWVGLSTGWLSWSTSWLGRSTRWLRWSTSWQGARWLGWSTSWLGWSTSWQGWSTCWLWLVELGRLGLLKLARLGQGSGLVLDGAGEGGYLPQEPPVPGGEPVGSIHIQDVGVLIPNLNDLGSLGPPASLPILGWVMQGNMITTLECW